MEYPKFKVCVRCFTFNHSKYITDAMNGFVMQQTDFPYVCCIVDDASKDGEQEVIRKYVADNFDLSEGSCHFERETDYAFITYAQHKTNKNCYFAVLYLKENHYSIKKPKMPYLAEWEDGCEYHALCEGDDYWIHPGKLQMQAEFLDGHEDYSMCFHNAIIHWELNERDDSCFANLETREYLAKELLKDWMAPTASFFMRKDYRKYKEQAHIDSNNIIHGDNLVLICNLCVGRVYAFSDSFSVYRKQQNGMVYSKSLQHMKKYCNQLIYCSNIFRQYKKEIRLPLSLFYFQIFQSYFSDSSYLFGLHYLLKSFFCNPKECFNYLLNYIKYRLEKSDIA